MTHDTDRLLRLEHEMGRLVRRVRRVIGERSRLVHADLQPSSYLLLSFLATAGPARQAVLVEELGIDKGAVSRQVQHLVDLGMVERTPDPADGRATLLAVTAEAQGRLADVAAARRRLLADQLGAWSDEELTSFVDALSRYNAALDDTARPDTDGGLGQVR